MARLHEYQSKAILSANGFKIPRGCAASNPDEAAAAANQLGEDVARVHFGFSSQSFWNRRSLRSGWNIGSSRSSAGVSGMFPATPAYGTESIFCKAAMARSGS